MKGLRYLLLVGITTLGWACASDELPTGSFGDSHVILVGTVKDESTGSPVAGALVRAILRIDSCQASAWTAPYEFRTSSAGTFSEELVVPGGLGSRTGCFEISIEPPASSGLSATTVTVNNVSITPSHIAADTVALEISLQ